MLGFGTRISFAFRSFFALLFNARVPDDVLDSFRPLAATPPPAARPDESADRALQLLAILQRDGRLLDFLQENISAYNDAQVGAAVRNVHASCHQSLARYLTFEPVLTQLEGDTLEVDGITDPNRIRIVGELAGRRGRRGIVRHRGWRATQVSLPPLPPGDCSVLAAAEVEVQ